MNFLKLLSFFTCLFLLFACETKQDLTAQQIVDAAIEKAGGDAYESSEINFTFRKGHYKSIRSCGTFSLERVLRDSLGTKTRDIVSNNGLIRERNDTVVKVADSLVTQISDAVNSVHYFAQLPYGLNSTAVQKERKGETKIGGKTYYKIKVWFKEEGGGTDFQDVYMYWINKKDFTVDYLAYSYEVNGGGIRFREAYNPRFINGIRVVDYYNYKPPTKDVPLTDLDAYFIKDKLQKVSEINTENVEVNLLDIKC